MAAKTSSPSGGSAAAGNAGMGWHQGRGAGFEWVSPAPSPMVVAELERLFPDIVQVPEQPLLSEVDNWANQSIIARCLSRWIPPEVITREFHRAAIPGKIDALALANKHYIFHFSDARAKSLVLGQPWVVFGQPIITAEWIPEFVPVASSVHSALLWIRLPLLPIEFWNDDILSSILAVAGQFLYSDESTKGRKRGSFARACVRVDLSKPLRPGARIRGSRAPFWQQFCYENLDGICSNCGSVHLEGPCRIDPASSSPSPASAFGPWMAAVRRRKAPLVSPSSEQATGSRPPRVDGWELPKKIARRQLSGGDAGVSPPTVRAVAEEGVSVPVDVPVSVGTVAMYQEGGVSEIEGAVQVSITNVASDSNPFACLRADSPTVRPKSRVVDCNGPLKRTRPAETMTQRVVSKSTKAKGKAPLVGSGSVQGPFSFQAADVSPRGSPQPSGSGMKRLRRKDGSGRGASSGTSAPAQLEEDSHGSAVLRLKQAILRGGEGVTLGSSRPVEEAARDSSLLMECRIQEPLEDTDPDVGPGADEMMGDRVGVPPTQPSE